MIDKDKQEFQEAMGALMNTVRWTSTPLTDDAGQDPNLPYATHEGILTLPGLGDVPVYQLNTGERVFDGETIERLLGLDATNEET